MTEYYFQTDDYSCGPVAILNATKWAGFDDFDDETFLKEMRIASSCKPFTKHSSGWLRGGITNNKDLSVGIESRTELQIMERMDNPGMIDIRRAIDEGYGVILSHKNKYVSRSGHIIFIASRQGNDYKVINNGNNLRRKITFMSSTELGNLMRASKKALYYRPTAIFVRRNPNAPRA